MNKRRLMLQRLRARKKMMLNRRKLMLRKLAAQKRRRLFFPRKRSIGILF